MCLATEQAVLRTRANLPTVYTGLYRPGTAIALRSGPAIRYARFGFPFLHSAGRRDVATLADFVSPRTVAIDVIVIVARRRRLRRRRPSP